MQLLAINRDEMLVPEAKCNFQLTLCLHLTSMFCHSTWKSQVEVQKSPLGPVTVLLNKSYSV